MQRSDQQRLTEVACMESGFPGDGDVYERDEPDSGAYPAGSQQGGELTGDEYLDSGGEGGDDASGDSYLKWNEFVEDGAESAEDDPIAKRVEEVLTEAEREDRLGELYDQLGDDGVELEPNELEGVFELFEQADRDATAADDARVAEQRRVDEVREKIFAKLRRPAGAPYANGPAGSATRKAAYRHEQHMAGSTRMPQSPTSPQWTTVYEPRDTIDERATKPGEMKTAQAGLVLDAAGTPVHGTWGWVMDADTGKLLLFDPNAAVAIAPDNTRVAIKASEIHDKIRAGYRVEAVHHTTPVAGMPVTGAGLITLDQGRITELSDQSGHYQPGADQQSQALEALIRQGYSLEEATIKLTGATAGSRPTSKGEWLNEAKKTNPRFDTRDVSLDYERFEQTQGDEYQLRMKAALNKEFKAEWGELQMPAEATGVGQRPSPETATFVGESRAYLSRVGPDAFRSWYGGLTKEQQTMLQGDAEIAGVVAPAAAPTTQASPAATEPQFDQARGGWIQYFPGKGWMQYDDNNKEWIPLDEA